MFHLRAILMVLIGIRLLMPPGICVCKWSSPASRYLAALLLLERPVPIEEHREDDDDHAPGCPASPLAAGMGVKPATTPLLPPSLSLDPPPPLESTQPFFAVNSVQASAVRLDSSQDPLYLTLRALLI